MLTINWSGYEWQPQMRWGAVAPNNKLFYYDQSAITINDDDSITLKTQYNPKHWEQYNTTTPIGIGLISCTEKFDFGRFEIEAKLPKQPYLWPAFWMWSWSDWPPEIDVFEAYSNKKGSYFKLQGDSPLGFWNVQSNVHYGSHTEGTHKMIRAKTHWMGLNDPGEHFVKYACEWTPNEITFIFNDRVVRRCNDRKILDQFATHKMNVVINNSIQEQADLTETHPKSEFIVKYFKYEPM